MRRLSGKCENLDVSEPFGPPRTSAGIGLPFFFVIREILVQRDILLENIKLTEVDRFLILGRGTYNCKWIKGKIIPEFQLISHHAMGSEDTAPAILTSALNEGEWSDSRPCRFIPGETAPATHPCKRLVGRRAGLNDIGTRNNYCCFW